MRLRCGTSSIDGGSPRCTYGEGGSDLLIVTSWSCSADSRLGHSAPIPLSDKRKGTKDTSFKVDHRRPASVRSFGQPFLAPPATKAPIGFLFDPADHLRNSPPVIFV